MSQFHRSRRGAFALWVCRAWAACWLLGVGDVSGLAAGPTLQWIRQFGTSVSQDEFLHGLAFDGSDSLYLAGSTRGSLGGPNAGGSDVWLAKYDVAGNPQWVQQFGTTGDQSARDIAVDGLGNVFYTWFWSGEGARIDNRDATGNHQWTRISPIFHTHAVAADWHGNAYTLGSIAGDAGLIRYDGAGNQLWRRDISIDYGSGSGTAQNFELSVDPAGNVFAYTEIIYSASPFGGSSRQRVALTKFDADGVQGWTRELVNGRYVRLGGVAADELGNVYITGSANAPLAGHVIGLEGYEGFVAKYDADGNQQWLRRIGNAASQFAQHARDLTVDGLGNVYVAGSTGLVLGQQSFGGSDMYLAKFDSDGNQFWIHQFGTSSAEDSAHVQADGLGNVFVAGRTKGDFGGPHSGGGYDIFLAKFFDGPTIDGDLNGDGVVDGLDFLAWQRGQSPTPHSAADLDQWKAMFPAASPMLEGDFDNNGVVDGADFLLWQRGQSPNQFNSASDLAQWQANYGRVAGDATAASVPEPGTLTAAWLIAGCIALVRNSRGIVRRTRTARLHN